MQRGPDRVLDEYLVLLAQAGSSVALGELIRRWRPKLIRHARHLIGPGAQADDIVQESLLAVVRGLKGLKDPARFPAWAFSIATRKSADAIRSAMRTRALQERASHDPTMASYPEDLSETLDVRSALARLPRDQAIVTSMFYGAELSIEEIADALDIPAGTVKSRLHHAREKLKTIIGKD